MTILKISDITAANLAEFIHLPDPTVDDYTTLNTMLDIAVAYMEQYTGHTSEELDEYQDCVIVAMVLVQDMWDNRSMYVDITNTNKVVESILNLHQANLL